MNHPSKQQSEVAPREAKENKFQPPIAVPKIIIPENAFHATFRFCGSTAVFRFLN
jgi:hypothetical protein